MEKRQLGQSLLSDSSSPWHAVCQSRTLLVCVFGSICVSSGLIALAINRADSSAFTNRQGSMTLAGKKDKSKKIVIGGFEDLEEIREQIRFNEALRLTTPPPSDIDREIARIEEMRARKVISELVIEPGRCRVSFPVNKLSDAKVSMFIPNGYPDVEPPQFTWEYVPDELSLDLEFLQNEWDWEPGEVCVADWLLHAKDIIKEEAREYNKAQAEMKHQEWKDGEEQRKEEALLRKEAKDNLRIRVASDAVEAMRAATDGLRVTEEQAEIDRKERGAKLKRFNEGPEEDKVHINHKKELAIKKIMEKRAEDIKKGIPVRKNAPQFNADGTKIKGTGDR